MKMGNLHLVISPDSDHIGFVDMVRIVISKNKKTGEFVVTFKLFIVKDILEGLKVPSKEVLEKIYKLAGNAHHTSSNFTFSFNHKWCLFIRE